MSAYIVVQLDIVDPDKLETYRAEVPATIETYGGRYLARGGQMERLEGEEPMSRVVILEFPNYAQAKAWYGSEEYADLKAMRLAASRSNAILVDGL